MTNQSRPLFSVGEEVILLPSDEFPLYKGEFRVINVVAPRSRYRDRIHNDDRYSTSTVEFGYQLDEIHYNPKKNTDILWSESSLKKKQFPSSQSFSELMDSLKTPAKAT